MPYYPGKFLEVRGDTDRPVTIADQRGTKGIQFITTVHKEWVTTRVTEVRRELE